MLIHLVIDLISQPLIKSGTVEYQKSYFDEDVELRKINRYLDKLHKKQQEKIQQISVVHTRRILGGKIVLVSYDATTLFLRQIRAVNFAKKDGQKTASTFSRK